jgi:hypothetical protein
MTDHVDRAFSTIPGRCFRYVEGDAGSALPCPEPVVVRGHEKVPTSGQLKGPLVATKSTHWWPGEVPTPH